MSQFELNWVGEYIPKLVTENDFLNTRLENDTYGIYYSVLFEGDADTYLMQAKKAPEEGVPEWGMIEMAKSGKSKRFKRMKREESPQTAVSFEKKPEPTFSKSKSDAYLKDVSNTPVMIYNGSLNYAKELGLNLISDEADRAAYLNYVKDISDEMLLWIEKIRNEA